ncbi:MAG: hypothetical protein EGR82_00575 [Ruminococcus bicirculans]|nr:hypothetical protein [Ruminococcus bicirculans (ex Wegman et al. 2014)]
MNFQGISESFLKKINVNHQFTIISYNVIIGELFFTREDILCFRYLWWRTTQALESSCLPHLNSMAM